MTDHGREELVARRSLAFMIFTGLFALGAAGLNALFDLVMMFAIDSCGTGTEDPPICDPTHWLLIAALPWLGLALALAASWLATRCAPQRRPPGWLVPLLPVPIYAAGCAVAARLVLS